MGPVSHEELCARAGRGEVLPADLVWKEGMADWLPLAGVPGLMGAGFSSAPIAVVQPPSVVPAQTGGSVPLPQPPAFQGHYVAPQISTYMWQSLVALILSAGMMMVICLPIGMPFAIVALVFASKVEGLKLHGRFVEAQAASRNAKIWMIISYALSGLVFVGIIVMVLIFVFSAGSGLLTP